MAFGTASQLGLGIGSTIFYVGLGVAALTLDLEPRWFFWAAAAVCFAAVPLTWYQIRKLRASSQPQS